MDLQQFLCVQFEQYRPPVPLVVSCSKHDVTLSWSSPGGAFTFLQPRDLLYRLQKREKYPPWTIVYSGSKTEKTIDNLAPGQPHVFRLQAQLKSEAVTELATRAIIHFGTAQAVLQQFGYEHTNSGDEKTDESNGNNNNDEAKVKETNHSYDETGNHKVEAKETHCGDDKVIMLKINLGNDTENGHEMMVNKPNYNIKNESFSEVKVEETDYDNKKNYNDLKKDEHNCGVNIKGFSEEKMVESEYHKDKGRDDEMKVEDTKTGEDEEIHETFKQSKIFEREEFGATYYSQYQAVKTETGQRPWLESRWSELAWCSTPQQGTSVVCFCMAVRCGHTKQVQQMLDERPELIEIINSINGFTPLITAIIKGELGMVKLLLQAGADANQPAAAGQRPLHFALLAARLDLAALLLRHGADIAARDRNGLRAEHYTVDGGGAGVLPWLLERGGQLEVQDNQGWTPLFRAVIQGASCELIAELVECGADVTAVGDRGLALPDAVRLLRDSRGGPRMSVVRLVDQGYPHERALDHFTRLTKKICSVQTIFK